MIYCYSKNPPNPQYRKDGDMYVNEKAETFIFIENKWIPVDICSKKHSITNEERFKNAMSILEEIK
jgi:hypothetical protein